METQHRVACFGSFREEAASWAVKQSGRGGAEAEAGVAQAKKLVVGGPVSC